LERGSEHKPGFVKIQGEFGCTAEKIGDIRLSWHKRSALVEIGQQAAVIQLTDLIGKQAFPGFCGS
jgi:hypothetical protein